MRATYDPCARCGQPTTPPGDVPEPQETTARGLPLPRHDRWAPVTAHHLSGRSRQGLEGVRALRPRLRGAIHSLDGTQRRFLACWRTVNGVLHGRPQRAGDDVARFGLHLGEVVGTAERLCVDLVDVLGPG